MHVSLRPATLRDVDDYIRIEKSVESRLTLVTTDPGEVEREIRESKVFMILADRKVAGIISYELQPGDIRAYLDEVAIDLGFQKQGVGTKAFGMVLGILRREGVSVVRLHTHPENRPARKLYETRFGFRVVGTVENYQNNGEPRLELECYV
jgi:ribosomal protein S18 acetylase RimI-like enzyme